MNQFESAHHGTDFPPLKLAYEVPGNALSLQRLDLGKGLLQAVFSGDLQSCIDGFADAVDRHRLACRHQPHSTLVPAGLHHHASDSIEYVFQTILD